MSKLSKTAEGIEWVRQFQTDDQELACKLVNAITLVTHDEFVADLRQLIIENAENTNGMVALFAEREIRKGKNKVLHRLYKEPYTKKNRRAHGMGPQPVKPKHNHDLTVGSEGIVAWLISELCQEHPKKFICHPSPGQIRQKRVRKFIVVTDIIGSGNRVYEYLESAWRVASVRSWVSLKYLSFEVIAYTGTSVGMKAVRCHKSKPAIDIVKACPTIKSEFDDEIFTKIKRLCTYYDPIDQDPVDSLGYKGGGVLIAFSHSCPNNIPRLLHKTKINFWEPLFPKRKTTKMRHIFGEQSNEEELKKRLDRLHETRLAKGHWLPSFSKEGKKMLLLLAALRRGPRFNEVISRKTGLIIPEIEILLEQAIQWNWVSEKRYLMEGGKGQLAHARKVKNTETSINEENKTSYFPKSLRAPQIASS